MSKLQEIFNKLKITKKEQKKLKRLYKDSLDNSQEYKEIANELKTLKERKKQIEESVKEDYKAEFAKLDSLQLDIQSDTEMMSDLALNQLVKGEVIEIKDEHDNNYEPQFKVSFKKI